VNRRTRGEEILVEQAAKNQPKISLAALLTIQPAMRSSFLGVFAKKRGKANKISLKMV